VHFYRTIIIFGASTLGALPLDLGPWLLLSLPIGVDVLLVILGARVYHLHIVDVVIVDVHWRWGVLPLGVTVRPWV
jgi:hypothetical protein